MSDRKLTRGAAWAAIVGVPLTLISIAFAVFVYLVPNTAAGNSAVGSPASSSPSPSAATSVSPATEKPAVTTPAPETAAAEPGAFQFWVESDGKRTYLGWNHSWSWWQLMLWWTIPAVAVFALGAFLVAKLSGRLNVLFAAVPVGFSYLVVFQYSFSVLGLLAAVLGFALVAAAAAEVGEEIA